MRLHHIVFGSALIVGGFAFAAPMAWDRHVFAVLLLLALIVVGLVLATGSKLLDVLHPTRREHYSRRDVNRAFEAGRNLGAVEGPDDKMRRRWQREGFEA